MSASGVVVGLDNGGTSNNATVLDTDGNFLVDGLLETPSRVKEGPDAAIPALVDAFRNALDVTGTASDAVLAVGLDTPGPATAEGVLSSKGATNFGHAGWSLFDVRGALEHALGVPVVYNNDANAAALYAHHEHFGADAGRRSSVAAIVGTGLGGAVIDSGRVLRGAAGMAGELGHIPIPMHDLLDDDQPIPRCNCGLTGDVESVASLTGIELNLLPYWLTRYPDHELASVDPVLAARRVRGLAEQGDEMALRIFGQQAKALGWLFSIAANYSDPHAYFVGGGVLEAAPHFRGWFVEEVSRHTQLRVEQQQAAELVVVPGLDSAGARGSAIAALESLSGA
jgi:predicted NBD/HSP70 family sugar kinase